MKGLEADVQAWLRRVAEQCPIDANGKVDLSKFEEELKRALDARLYQCLERGGADALRQAGSVASLNAQQSLIAEFMEAYTFTTTAVITETTREEIEAAILRMTDEGVSLRDTIVAVRETLPEAYKGRAEMIAQTESSRVYGMGNVVGWVKSGGGWKEWKLASNPCPQCEALVAELSLASAGDTSLPVRLRGRPVVAVELPFTETDYGPVYSHPLHPNCYCDVLFVNETTELTPEEANARADTILKEMKAAYDHVAAGVSEN